MDKFHQLKFYFISLHYFFLQFENKERRCSILVLLLLVFFINSAACTKPKLVETFHFEMIGTYVIIKAKINESSNLNLILDTGLRNIIITELFPGDKISLNYSDVKDLMGLGGEQQLQAYSSNYNILKTRKLKFTNTTVYVLKEDIFNLSKLTGFKINGLLGIDFFKDYIVEINYSKKRVRLYAHDNFIQPKGYDKVPIIIENQKMFVKLSAIQSDGSTQQVKMLLDTGAELNAWFQSYKDNAVQVPHQNVNATIGQGLNGEIKGKVGRLNELCLGKYCLKNPIVSFPDSASISDLVGNTERDGTIGSQILSRFNYYIDYKQREFYFKPNRYFDKPFNYNIAGIEISQIISFVNQMEVWKLWDNSPAEKAGVMVGDQIVEVNGQKAFMMNISELKKTFETPSKAKLKLTLIRHGKEIKVEFDMKSKI